MSAGINAFREAYMSSGASPAESADFRDWGARRLRYDVLWAYFENSAYRDIHLWAKKYKADYGLYRYTRGIYNPSYRLAMFWATHLMGGALDPKAGDGSAEPSALPIAGATASLRRAIAQLWLWSNWQTTKDIYTLKGAVLGDIALKVTDDVERQKVYLQVVHPGLIKDVTLDPFGNVKGYTIEEERPDPLGKQRSVTYTEVAFRDGDDVVYQTFLNTSPYGWNGMPPEWAEPYGFVPLVVAQHHNVGLDWGWSELHPGLGKFREVDDLASKLHDQIRKAVETPWLIAGFPAPAATPTVGQTAASSTRPEPGREEVPILYGPTGATATPLVAPLDIAATSAEIKEGLNELERDYPELSLLIKTASGDASGRALRVARQPVETKVQRRRPNYDNPLVRAHQMAVAIGGHRGYEGFRGFSLDSYAAGKLDHHIGKRPVFAVDPLDDLEEQSAFWTVASLADKSGYPIELYLQDAGWDQERIDRVVKRKAERQAQVQATLGQQQGQGVGQQGADGSAADA